MSAQDEDERAPKFPWSTAPDPDAGRSFGWAELPDGWEYGDSAVGELPPATAHRPWPVDLDAIAALFGGRGAHQLLRGTNDCVTVESTVPIGEGVAHVTFFQSRVASLITVMMNDGSSCVPIARELDIALLPLRDG